MPTPDELINFPLRTMRFGIFHDRATRTKAEKLSHLASRFANVSVRSEAGPYYENLYDAVFYIVGAGQPLPELVPSQLATEAIFVLADLRDNPSNLNSEFFYIDVGRWKFDRSPADDTVLAQALAYGKFAPREKGRIWRYDAPFTGELVKPPKIRFGAFITFLATPLDLLELSVRTYRALSDSGFKYVGDVAKSTEAQLLRTPNFGRKSLNEIREILAPDGLWVGMDIPYWPPSDLDLYAQRARVKLLLNQIEQQDLGTKFETGEEILEVKLDENPSDDEAAEEPITQQLHKEAVRKLKAFVDLARRLDNLAGWSGILALTDRFIELIDRPTSEVPEVIGLVYSHALEMGSFLEQNNEIRIGKNTYAEELPPEFRRPLEDFVRTSAPWVRRFPSARILDDETGQFLSQLALLKPAEATVKIALQSKIIDGETAMLVNSLLEAAPRGEHVGGKAGTRGVLSARNLAICAVSLLSAASAVAISAVASDVAAKSVLVQRAGSFLISAEKPILELVGDLPSDIKFAFESFIKDFPK